MAARCCRAVGPRAASASAPNVRLIWRSANGYGVFCRRAAFLYVAKGARASRPTVTVQARRLPEAPPVALVGFTATKKIGGAVVRNRAKRRLREAVRMVIGAAGRAGVGYVFVARDITASAPWPQLLDDVKSALLRLAPALDAHRAAPPPAPDSSKPEEPC